jgi:hypothetical protein
MPSPKSKKRKPQSANRALRYPPLAPPVLNLQLLFIVFVLVVKMAPDDLSPADGKIAKQTLTTQIPFPSVSI